MRSTSYSRDDGIILSRGQTANAEFAKDAKLMQRKLCANLAYSANSAFAVQDDGENTTMLLRRALGKELLLQRHHVNRLGSFAG